MSFDVSRRGFLRGAGALILSLSRLGPREVGAAPLAATSAGGAAPPPYRGWEDLYRQQWAWDSIRKGTHHVNCWYQRGCNWNVYVKEGLVFREEQAGTYPQTNPSVPDFNPRGCQKGACYSQRLYDAARLRYPLKRVGARGEGKWQRLSWEQALREIADDVIDALHQDGPGSITWDPGGGNTHGCRGIGLYGTGFLLDTPILDINCEVGDHHPGALATLGKISCASSGDDLFHSDLILIWGGNPTYTQIPNAHFINEARYHGARVVAIAPDYNASAIHADQWIAVNVGTDAAFGLAVAYVLVEEGLYDARFITEQTDLPLLVRTDTRTFLRQRDLQRGGDEDTFYLFDRTTNAVRPVAKRTLALEGVDPALEGEFRVTGVDGEITVTPVFALLRRQLAAYTPEVVAGLSGAHPQVVRTLARDIARAKAATVITQSNFSKFYHGLEMERAQILVLTLAGQVGKKGSGINVFPALDLAGIATDIKPDETITANTWHTEKKLPWPTLTRRIQFYIDHPFYLELEEALPTHKPPPQIGGDYPLQLTGQHARWSIHSSWRDEAHLLRLQRGGPVITLSVADAAARGLEDGDRARVHNDVGAFEVRVKVSATVRPGQVTINHAWEPYQFKGGRSHDAVVPSPINPLQIAGGYFHLQPAVLLGAAGGVDRGTRVDVERLGDTMTSSATLLTQRHEVIRELAHCASAAKVIGPS